MYYLAFLLISIDNVQQVWPWPESLLVLLSKDKTEKLGAMVDTFMWNDSTDMPGSQACSGGCSNQRGLFRGRVHLHDLQSQRL